MTRILEVVATYTPRGDGMMHDGFFVVSNNYPLKWVDARRWAHLTAHPTALTLRLDHTLAALGGAR